MPLSWNELKHRAIAFSKEWQDETREEAKAKSFWDAFFHVFGQQRRHVASYQEPVKKLSGDWGFIDLFWPKPLLAEHKSAGKDLGKAHPHPSPAWRGGYALRVPAIPPALPTAHAALVRAVDKCHRPADFPSDRDRVEYLFQRYEQLTAPLAPTAKPKRTRKARN